MAVLIGSARSDERGKITGGAAGDQTGKEVSTQNWYLHKKGWVVIRANDPAVREKIAKSMEMICANNNIGYDQRNRNGLYNAVKNKNFNASKCTVKTECDCSAAVRVCVHYAGIKCGDFNTSSELKVLKGTKAFTAYTESKYTNSSDYLLRGDILVTKTKGHTVVVLSNGSKAAASNTSTSTKLAVPIYTIKYGSKGTNVKNLQIALNSLKLKDSAGKVIVLKVDGDCGSKTCDAIKVFEKTYGLKVDSGSGIYGKECYAKMKQLLA